MKLMPLMRELFPIYRSITGDGFKQSLEILSRELDLTIREYPSGQECFEWTVPDEWNITDAWIKDSSGNRVVDFKKNSLHVMSYSTPIHETMPFAKLKDHLHTVKDLPDAVPFRTSFYRRNWGFCISHNQLQEMAKNPDAEYEVCIESELKKGVLRIGEWYLPGESEKEIVFSSYNCHPAQANDGLSSTLVSVAVAKKLLELPRRKYSYRLLILPGTIGSITYLYNNPDWVAKVAGGYVYACLGDKGKMNYKKTYQGDHEVDKAMIAALEWEKADHVVRDFWPWGGDEGHYNSPGFRMPMGSLMRSPYMEYPEYHTSLDNLDFVTEEAMQESVRVYWRAVQNLEMNERYKVLIKGEPKLDKHNMYVSPAVDRNRFLGTNYFFLMSDGTHSLLDIHTKSGVDLETLHAIAEKALSVGLVSRVENGKA